MKAGHAIVFFGIVISVIGTFFFASVINGFSAVTGNAEGSDFASVTGNVVASEGFIDSFQAAVSSVLFGLVSIAAIVVVARIGSGAAAEAFEGRKPAIQSSLERAEEALGQGDHRAAFSLYSSIRQQYASLGNEEKLGHYDRIISLHKGLERQSMVAEANQLTDKYVKGTITEAEFERLRYLVLSQ